MTVEMANTAASVLHYGNRTLMTCEEKVLRHSLQAQEAHEKLICMHITCLEGRVVAQVAERMPGPCHVPVHDFALIAVETGGCVQVETLHPGLESAATNTLLSMAFAGLRLFSYNSSTLIVGLHGMFGEFFFCNNFTRLFLRPF
jgi:hypothetical protein